MKVKELPTLSSYGRYSSKNYGVHCLKVEFPPMHTNGSGIVLYFSYETIVAFEGNVEGWHKYVRKNVWGTTTGKHLNFIDNGMRNARLDEKEFIKLYKIALKAA